MLTNKTENIFMYLKGLCRIYKGGSKFLLVSERKVNNFEPIQVSYTNKHI